MQNYSNQYDIRTISAFDTWFADLSGRDRRAFAKVRSAITQLGNGNLHNNVKSVRDGVFERRIDYGPGYRIYFGRDGERLIILIGGGVKDSQQQDIEDAQRLWREYNGST